MQEYQQRVVDEASELRIKQRDLHNFIYYSKVYSDLPEEDQGLLARQNGHMINYLQILEQRIAKF